MLDEHDILDEDDALEVTIVNIIVYCYKCLLILFNLLFKDDLGYSDIDESKVLGDIADKEENNVGNGNIHEEKEVKQVFYLV